MWNVPELLEHSLEHHVAESRLPRMEPGKGEFRVVGYFFSFNSYIVFLL